MLLPPVPTALLLSFLKISVPHRNKIPEERADGLRQSRITRSLCQGKQNGNDFGAFWDPYAADIAKPRDRKGTRIDGW